MEDELPTPAGKINGDRARRPNDDDFLRNAG
jgi:hypothetical protein